MITGKSIKAFFIRLWKSAFIRSLLVMMSGTVAAQIIGYALYPVISRLFSPSDFGVFGSFDAVLTIITAGVTLEYYQAIMLPKERKDAFHLFVISCLSTFGIGSVCLVACLIAPGTMKSLIKTSGTWALVLLVLSTVISGLNFACMAWCIRVKAFKHAAGSQVIRSLSSNGLQLGFGFLKVGAPGLIISSVSANVLASLNLIRVLLPDLKTLGPSIRWNRIKELAYEYRDFPAWSASVSYINALSGGLPVLLLARFYGIAVAGAFAFALRIIQAPLSILAGALRQVLFQKACETQHEGRRLLPLYMKTTTGLFVISVVPSMVLLFWAPQIFTLIFGPKWHTAGDLARSLALWLTTLCGLPSYLFARAMRMQRKLFFFELVRLVIGTFALIAGGVYLTSAQTILAYSAASVIISLVLVFVVGRALVRKEGDRSWKFDSNTESKL